MGVSCSRLSFSLTKKTADLWQWHTIHHCQTRNGMIQVMYTNALMVGHFSNAPHDFVD